MEKKKVSIVICTYNGEKFIREQLNSILGQTAYIHEIIIQDDCSTDNTYSILCKYAQTYSLITVTQNERQMGINRNFFSAIEKTTGDYIAISDQDDIWEPEKLELQLEAIGDKLLCGSLSKPFSTDGTPIRYDSRTPNYNLLRLVYIGALSGHTLLFPRRLLSLMPNISGLSPYRLYDVILCMVAAAHESIAFVDRALVNHRRFVTAASYTTPTENKFTIQNIFHSALRTYRYHRELKPEIDKRLIATQEFLLQIDSKKPVLKDALRMIHLRVNHSLINTIRLTAFCVRHREKLFYAPVKKNFLSLVRAIYFPISCSDYYRYLSPRFTKDTPKKP